MHVETSVIHFRHHFYLWAGHEKLGYEHAFQPYTYNLRPFAWGGAPNAPQLWIDSDPPTFTGLKVFLILLKGSLDVILSMSKLQSYHLNHRMSKNEKFVFFSLNILFKTEVRLLKSDLQIYFWWGYDNTLRDFAGHLCCRQQTILIDALDKNKIIDDRFRILFGFSQCPFTFF